jgi:O-antigen ligase
MRSLLVVVAAASAVGLGIASTNPWLRLSAAIGAVAVVGIGLTLVRGEIAYGPDGGALPDRSRSLAQRVLLFAVPALIALNALDVRGYFLERTGDARYLLLVPFYLALAFAVALSRPAGARVTDVALKLFATLAIGGALYGLIHARPASSALPLAVTSLFALSYLGLGQLTDDDCTRVLRWLEIAAYVYVLFHLGAALGLFNSGINRSVGPSSLFSNGSFTHEKAPLLLMALHLAIRRRSVVLILAVAGAIVAIYLRYPAGTYAAVFGVYLVFLVALSLKRRVVVGAFAAIVIAAIVVVVQLSNTDTKFGSAYFSRVGKTDNVSTRILLWSAAEDAIHRHPVFGSAFSGEATVRVSAGNLPPRVPPHNDYLEILLLGGGFGLVLFLAKIVQAGRQLDRALTVAVANSARRALIEVTAVGIASFLVVFIFNPVLLKVSLGSLFFALLGLVPSLCLAAPSRDSNAVSSAAAVRHREHAAYV